jgi:hypothetical protein
MHHNLPEPLLEVVFGLAGFLIGAAALYLLSFGRITPTSQVSYRWWGFGRLPNGKIGVDAELVMTVGLLIPIAVLGVGVWMGSLH